MLIKKIQNGLMAALTLVLSYLAADIFWLLVQPQVAAPIVVNIGGKSTTDLVVKRNIFGKQAAQVKKPSKEVKQSKLNLVLIGVLFKREKSFAIIAHSNAIALAKTYQAGDSIKTGIRVKEIGENFVILARGETLERLVFKPNGAGSRVINKSKVHNSKLSITQKNKLDNYRLQIVSNPTKLLSVVSVAPFFKDGKMLGVKVKPNKNKQIFKDLGLKSSDIITKINHIDIDSFDKFAQIRQIIYTSSLFDLKIKRNNKIVYLSIQL